MPETKSVQFTGMVEKYDLTPEEVAEAQDQAVEGAISGLFAASRAVGKELQMMGHIVYAHEETGKGVSVVVIPIGNVDTDDFATAFKMFAQEKKAIWAAVMAEAWTVTSKSGNPEDLTVRPSQHPDRKENLVLAVEGPLGSRLVNWEIKGKELGEPQIVHNYEGKFSHLLPKSDPAEALN